MKNLFIFVADSLRMDYMPESIAEKGTVLKTLTPGLHTPVSFSSMITCRSPERHNVRGFEDRLAGYETVFDRFENGCYYDYELDPMRRNVFKDAPSGEELEDLEEPFVFVERAMETHTPYNEVNHGNELTHVNDGDYTRSFESNEKLREAYREGVKGAEEHFWNHMETLEERGILDDTLVVFTSDHGELLGEKKNFRKRYAHGHPMSQELVQVPTVFLNHEFETDHMRTIDIVETALKILGKDSLEEDGGDIRENSPDRGRVVNDGYVSYDTEWVFKNRNWNPQSSLGLNYEIFREDLRILLNKYDKGGFIPRPGKAVAESEIGDIDF